MYAKTTDCHFPDVRRTFYPLAACGNYAIQTVRPRRHRLLPQTRLRRQRRMPDFWQCSPMKLLRLISPRAGASAILL